MAEGKGAPVEPRLPVLVIGTEDSFEPEETLRDGRADISCGSSRMRTDLLLWFRGRCARLLSCMDGFEA